MNQTQIEAYSLQSLAEIHAALGGWPCVEGDNWNPNSTWNWRDGSRDLLHAGFGHAYLFVLSIDTGDDHKKNNASTFSANLLVLLSIFTDMRNSSRKRIVVCVKHASST